jgi:hypothetical protein
MHRRDDNNRILADDEEDSIRKSMDECSPQLPEGRGETKRL